MVTTTDYINIISNMDSKNAIKGFNQLDTAMSNFQSKLSGAKGFSKFNSQLKDAGLVMRRNGQIQRQGTIQTISQAKAMNMILDREKQVLSLKQERMALMAKPEGMEEMFAIRQTGTELGRAKKEGLDVTNQINEMNKRLAKSPKMARAFANGMKQGRKSFDMFNLSLLFSGMQIKMFGQAVMKFMIPSMDKLNQLNTEGAKEVMAMNASFEFLKISMFEALSNTGIFQTFIEYLIKAAEWSSEFIQNNPGWAVAGIVIAAAATAIGTSFVIASGWNQFASTVYGMWSGGTGIKAMLGTTGKGGKIGKALTGFKNFVDNNQNLIMKFGISMGGAAISAAAITSMLNTEDLAGKVGFGIAGALGAAGAITAWFNPMVGLTLVVAGTVLFALTKYRFEIAGEMNKDKILRDYLKGAGLYNIDMEKEMAAYSLHGATGTTATVYDVDKMGIVASDNLLKQYIRTNSELEELQKQLNMNAEQGKFDEVRAIQSKIDKTQEEMSNVMEIGMIADKNFTKRIENEMKIINLEDERIQKILSAKSEEATAFSDTFSEQVKSKEKTDEMIENIKLFGTTVSDVFGGTGDSVGVIGNFNALDMEIDTIQTDFTALKSEINDWASVVTTKVIEIEYRYKNENEDSGRFESIGKAADELISSVTG